MSDTIAATQHTAPGRIVLKLRFDEAYDAFMQKGKLAPTLSLLARLLDIPPSEISLREVRSGCTIVVTDVSSEYLEQIQKLINKLHNGRIILADIESLPAEQREIVNGKPKVSLGEIEGAPHFRRNEIFDPDLSWLHLSDLHITDDYGDRTSETSADLRRFLRDLPRCLGEAGIEPDAVFFTGDVAYSGLESQYEQANLFFGELKSKLPPASRDAPFLVIPGNHDVTWDQVAIKKEMDLRKRLAESEEVEQIEREFHDHITKRHTNYIKFSRDFNDRACDWFDANAFTRCFTAGRRDVKVGVAGLDSAWLSTRKDLLKKALGIDEKVHTNLDFERLALGAGQIRGGMQRIEEADVNLRIALIHHEPRSEWYHGADRQLQRQEMNFFDFVLRGHQHEPQAREGISIDDDYVELAPGALRTRPRHFQGFMTVELDFTAQLMRLSAWTVTPVATKWYLDPDFGKSGRTTRPLPPGLSDRLPRRRPGERLVS